MPFSAQNPAAAAYLCIAGLEKLTTTPDKFDTIHSNSDIFFCDGAALICC